MNISPMHRLLIILPLLLSYFCAVAQGDGVTFLSYSHNFGTVNEADGEVSHTFVFRNDGKREMNVLFTNPSCSCITTNFSKEKVKPGNVGEITVIFSPSGADGNTYRTVEVFDNENNCIGVLEINAIVIPADRTIQERYFYTLGDMIYISRINVPFGYITKGQSITKTIYIANAGGSTSELKADYAENQYFKANFPSEINAGEEIPITLTYSLPSDKEIFKTFADTLFIYVNGRKTNLNITTKAIGIKAMQKSENQPFMRTYPSAAALNNKHEGEIEISNDGNADLEILHIETVAGAKYNINPGQKIKPNEKFVVKVKFIDNRYNTFNIFTNDTLRPYKELIFK